jgi:hypothetical protein
MRKSGSAGEMRPVLSSITLLLKKVEYRSEASSPVPGAAAAAGPDVGNRAPDSI